jgi:hypothetical protein
MMIIRATLAAGLIGCTLLAGCDGDDNKPRANLTPQGTFSDVTNDTVVAGSSSEAATAAEIAKPKPRVDIVGLASFVNPMIGTTQSSSGLHSGNNGIGQSRDSQCRSRRRGVSCESSRFA